MALLSGAVLMLGLSVANPDAWIARHNIERYEATGKVDLYYLRGLSADATPTLTALLSGTNLWCALAGESLRPDDWAGWNLSRVRARDALEQLSLPVRGDEVGIASC